jgi:beta-lactamase class A
MSDKNLQDVIGELTAAIPGRVGVCAETINGGRRISIDADESYPTASSIKVFILYTLLAEVDSHHVSLGERLDHLPHNFTPGSGVLIHLDAGLKPTLKDLATLMMMISDNSATNILIEYLGLDTINEAISRIPLEHTRAGSWRNFQDPERDSFSLGQGTPGEFVRFLLRLRQGQLLSSTSTELFWDILRVQKYIEPLRKYLPASPWAREWDRPEPVWVASKPGHLIDCTTESGLIVAHGIEWAISVMTRDMPSADENPDNIGERLISDVSLLVYRAWSTTDK